MTLDPWLAKGAVLAGSIAMVLIRAPHGQRSRGIKVRKSRQGRLEVALLTFAWIGFFIPMLWVWKPVFAFAEHPPRPAPFAAGVALMAAGLWCLYRSHADLGTNWSITLEVREAHRLVTDGIYRRVRHPMYSAFFLYSVGLLLALPNWVAGSSYLVSLGLLFALRVGPEERMMREEFGAEYDAYMARTRRLIPGIW